MKTNLSRKTLLFGRISRNSVNNVSQSPKIVSLSLRKKYLEIFPELKILMHQDPIASYISSGNPFPSTRSSSANIHFFRPKGTSHSLLVQQRTILIPKKGDPENYRPIICFNTLYEIFTGILNERVLSTIGPIWNNIYEQRGSERRLACCKDNLLIDRSICHDATYHKRNLLTAYYPCPSTYYQMH